LRAADEPRAIGTVVPGANRVCQSLDFGNFCGSLSHLNKGLITAKTAGGTSGAFVASVFSTRGRRCGRTGMLRRWHCVLIAPNLLLFPRLLTGDLPVQFWVGGPCHHYGNKQEKGWQESSVRCGLQGIPGTPEN
jgi:hypothetical protein